MTTTVSFTVLGEPQPWSVYTRRGKEPLGHQKMRAYQQVIQAHANVAMMGREPLQGPVMVKLVFYVTPQEERKGREKEGDLTNYQKAVEDALNKIVFKDDKQTVIMQSEKCLYGEPRTEIQVRNDEGNWRE